MARILAVDDVEDNVFLLRMILENHNHEVIPAYSGAEALKVIEKTPVDLVLLDLMMPGMSGLDVAQRIKLMDSARHVPVILLTAKKKEVDDVVHALDSGADEYISKPFHETELVARVKSMLRMKSLFDQIEEDRRLMADDLHTAQHVQKSLLPTTFPYGGKVRITAHYESTTSLGGDYYDVLDYGNGKIGALMADVSGHGASAALIVSMIKTIMISHMDADPDPAELCGLLNDRLIGIIPAESYFTMFLGIIDLNSGALKYVRAGHPYPFLLRGGDGTVSRLEAKGDLLGLFDTVELQIGQEELGPGDKLITYSDGLFEVYNEAGEAFGIDRLQNEVRAGAGDEGDLFMRRLVDKANSFSASATIDDDVAALLLEIL